MLTSKRIYVCLCLFSLLVSCRPPEPEDTIQIIRTPVEGQFVVVPFETAVPVEIVPFTPIPFYPELSASLTCPGSVAAGEQIGNRLQVVVTDSGQPSPAFFVDLVLSTDTTIPIQYAVPSPSFTEDMLLNGGREQLDSLDSGSSASVSFPSTVALPSDTPDGNYYLGVVVDTGNQVTELNEENNVTLCPIQVCPMAADMLYMTLLEFGGSVTGFARMKLAWGWGDGLPPEQLLITVFRWEEEWENVMPSQESYTVESPESTSQADVIIRRALNGKYQIVFDAMYTCNRHRKYIYELTIP